MAELSTYRDNYQNIRIQRDAAGVLEMQFHTDGGPFRWSLQAHADCEQASSISVATRPMKSSS